MASPAFERFRWSFFEDPYSWHDGLDTKALGGLVGEERARAEEMLIDYLPDTRGVVGLGVLRSRRAERQLLALFEVERAEQGSGLVDLAKALWRIRPDTRWSSALIGVLTSSEYHIRRMDAAIALREVPDPAAVPALIAALDDPESLVRHHAARALLTIHGLPVDSMDPQQSRDVRRRRTAQGRQARYFERNRRADPFVARKGRPEAGDIAQRRLPNLLPLAAVPSLLAVS